MGVIDGLSLPSVLREGVVSGHRLSDDELRLFVEYQARFLKPLQIAERLYCDVCYRENREDGCRAQVMPNGLSAIVKVECRCRVMEGSGGGLH